MTDKGKKRLLWGLAGLVIIGLAAAAACFFISMGMKKTEEKNIVCTVQGSIEIGGQAQKQLKEFQADCIMVLGAGLKDKETPSDMLRDRLDTGIALYKLGIAPKLLLTGDNGQTEYNEIHVMLNYAKEAGVPEEDIFCDHAGFSTYDSMYRASSIFQAEKIIVVTQKYHQYRALYIGEKLDLEVLGVASDQQAYRGGVYREMREILARAKDFLKVMTGGKATLGGEVIPISGEGLISHGE